MLKKISVSQVCLGMFVEELCGSWMDHPFWQTRFLLTSPKDLDRLKSSVVREVFIDTSKGLDVAGGVEKAEVVAESQAVLLEAAVTVPTIERVSFDEEMQRARMLCARSRDAVVDMFADVRMGRAVDAEQARTLVDDIWQSVSRHPNALISIARLKTVDEYTYMHSVAVCALMIALGRQLGMEEAALREAGLAGLFHDVGKAGIPDAILNKAGRLTDDEWRIMCGHPESGTKYLAGTVHASDEVIDVCLHHHEKTDGSGYPHGLKGPEISLLASMGTVCDVYDAITSERPYKRGWNPGEAIRKMAEWSKGHFNSTVFQAFVKSVGIYPTGSLVRLQSGRLAVVLEQNETSLLTPKVKVFYSARTSARIAERVVDLATMTGSDKIVALEDAAQWGFDDLDRVWKTSP
jgi:HD-GYP domain-containing protein (c-di-GMP phosphodiesterase class II)